MAVPASIGQWGGGGVKQTGIKLALFPSTQRSIPIELQQSTGSTLASSQWTSVFLPPSTRGASLQYTATLPLSTKRFFFRARHVGGGFSAGAFTPTVSARPVVIPDYPPPITMNAAGNLEIVGGDVLISSANKPKVGSQNTSSYITKSIRFPGMALLRESTNYPEGSRTNIGTLAIGLNTSGLYQWQYVIPKGVVIRKLRYCAGQRTSTSMVSQLKLYKISTGGTATAICTITMTTAVADFPIVVTSSALSESVTDVSDYVGQVTLKTVGLANPKIVYSEIEYSMANYVAAY